MIYDLAFRRGLLQPDSQLSDRPLLDDQQQARNLIANLGSLSASRPWSARAMCRQWRLIIGGSAVITAFATLGLCQRGGSSRLQRRHWWSALSPLQLAQGYGRWSSDAASVTTIKMQSIPIDLQQPEWRPAWKTGTSSGRRDAWCLAISEQAVVVMARRRDAAPRPALVGGYQARQLCSQISQLSAVTAR